MFPLADVATLQHLGSGIGCRRKKYGCLGKVFDLIREVYYNILGDTTGDGLHLHVLPEASHTSTTSLLVVC